MIWVFINPSVPFGKTADCLRNPVRYSGLLKFGCRYCAQHVSDRSACKQDLEDLWNQSFYFTSCPAHHACSRDCGMRVVFRLCLSGVREGQESGAGDFDCRMKTLCGKSSHWLFSCVMIILHIEILFLP